MKPNKFLNLSAMLTKIATTPGQSSFSSNENKTTQVKFPTICANNPIKSTALPLGYQGKVKPDARCLAKMMTEQF